MTKQAGQPPASTRGGVKLALAIGVPLAVVLVIVGVWLSSGGQGHPPQAPPPTASPNPSVSSSPGEPTSAPTVDATPEPTATPASEQPSAPPRTEEPSVPLDEGAEVRQGITAEVTMIEAVAGEAVLPGEVSGPALRVTVRIVNDSTARLDLTTAVVTLAAGDPLRDANPVSRPAGAPFPRDLQPRGSAEGKFVFEVPLEQRDLVRITVDLSLADPIVTFEGPVR